VVIWTLILDTLDITPAAKTPISPSHRIYSADLAKWITRDPLENAEFLQGSNLYEYVRTNPIAYVDPKGENVWLYALWVGILGSAAYEGIHYAKLSHEIGETQAEIYDADLNAAQADMRGTRKPPKNAKGRTQRLVSASKGIDLSPKACTRYDGFNWV
jgi:hypothetical protein